jgi:RNA polymerase sigma-70 factor (ECF subfamily)
MASELRQFIEQESEAMLRTLRGYLFRAGVGGERLDEAANELWQEVVLEALRHENRFQPDALPRPWLLGIASNLIKRHWQETQRRERREPLVKDLKPELELDEDDLFDWLAGTSAAREEVLADTDVTPLLKYLSATDQQIIRLALWYDLDGNAIARELDINPGTARVRLHRALRQLRQVVLTARDYHGN